MQLVKADDNYYAQDGATFPTFGEAAGHARRLAVTHYLDVMKKRVAAVAGTIHFDLRAELIQLGDAMSEILEERPALTYATGRPRQQSPLALAA